MLSEFVGDKMKEEIILELKETAAHIWKDHRCKAVGLFLGCVAGISVLIFGFFSTLFVLLCGSLGLYLGIVIMGAVPRLLKNICCRHN